jgi:hypothetical protein
VAWGCCLLLLLLLLCPEQRQGLARLLLQLLLQMHWGLLQL